jgi:hypothetical protein
VSTCNKLGFSSKIFLDIKNDVTWDAIWSNRLWSSFLKDIKSDLPCFISFLMAMAFIQRSVPVSLSISSMRWTLLGFRCPIYYFNFGTNLNGCNNLITLLDCERHPPGKGGFIGDIISNCIFSDFTWIQRLEVFQRLSWWRAILPKNLKKSSFCSLPQGLIIAMLDVRILFFKVSMVTMVVHYLTQY